MKKLLGLILGLGIIFGMLTPVVAASTYINEISIDVFVEDDGSATFKETWDMSVYEGTEVYKVFNNMSNRQLTLLSVTDDFGNTYKNRGAWDVNLSFSQKKNTSGLVDTGDGYELCFGIGEYGDRVYTFEYKIDRFIEQYVEGTQGINYAFMSDMGLSINKINVNLSSNYEFTNENSRIWGYGYEGLCEYNEGSIKMTSTGAVSKVQLLLEAQTDFFTNPLIVSQSFNDIETDANKESDYYDSYHSYDDYYYEEDGFTDTVFFMIMGMMFFGFVTMIIGIASKKGSLASQSKMVYDDGIEYSKANVMPYHFIPCEKNLLLFYYLAKRNNIITEQNKSGIIAAYLLKWIRHDQIKFVNEGKKGLVFKKESYYMDLGNDLQGENPIESQLMKFMLQAARRNGNSLLEKNEFEKWCSSQYTQIEEWFKSIDRYVEGELKSQGLMKLTFTQEKTMFGSRKVTNTTYSHILREELEKIQGLKEFLEDMDNMKEKEVMDVKLWDEYLMFASILGIADKVEKQLNVIYPHVDTTTQVGYPSMMDMIIISQFSRNMAHASMMSASSAAQATSFSGGGGMSSFGGGGGGFSGGGGGGVR